MYARSVHSSEGATNPSLNAIKLAKIERQLL
jgi:hypothetical protein